MNDNDLVQDDDMYIQGKPSIIVGAVDQLSDTPEQNVFASNSSGGQPI